jgi:hypothetical protein
MERSNMPIPREKLDIKTLMYEQVSYNILNSIGQAKFKDWDKYKLEGLCIGGDGLGIKYYTTQIVLHLAAYDFLELDKERPFLKFKEKGQHYANELFLSNPYCCGTRGEPFMWMYLARAFSNDRLPMDKKSFENKYRKIISDYGIPFGEDKHVYIEQFAYGGMSGGSIGGIFASKGLDILLIRLGKYN